jgi:hypothetical protein
MPGFELQLHNKRRERGPGNWREDWTPLFADEASVPKLAVISGAYDTLLQTYDDL